MHAIRKLEKCNGPVKGLITYRKSEQPRQAMSGRVNGKVQYCQLWELLRKRILSLFILRFQPHMGVPTHRGRAAQARDHCGEIHGGTVPRAPTEATLAHVEDLPEKPRAGPSGPRFLHRADGDVQGAFCPRDPGT